MLLFPPVSERDQAGVEELESQTASLLSFREIAKPVFDAQVAFNLLASYGEESKPRLADTRSAIARDVARYLAGRAPVPAIQLVQAPVFYGYAFAAYAEFASPESRATRSRVRESRCEGRRAGRPSADKCQRGRRKRNSSRAHRARSERRERRVALGSCRQSASCGDQRRAHRGGTGCEIAASENRRARDARWRCRWPRLFAPLSGRGLRLPRGRPRRAICPPNGQTIAVPAFTNDTTRYRIEQRFTQAVIREFITPDEIPRRAGSGIRRRRPARRSAFD